VNAVVREPNDILVVYMGSRHRQKSLSKERAWRGSENWPCDAELISPSFKYTGISGSFGGEG
ncbi:hypothetical protein, partial [Clostridioides difficile]|uniref:hypothetical protein n=1 Tax=Clostridioides difficile TaxID=1496 RepID=UPI001A9AE151